MLSTKEGKSKFDEYIFYGNQSFYVMLKFNANIVFSEDICVMISTLNKA